MTDPTVKAAAIEAMRVYFVSRGMDSKLAAKAAAEFVEQADRARSDDGH